jgi:hypothetical protein
MQEPERPTKKMSERPWRRLAIGGVGVAAILFAGVLVALAGLRDDQQPLGFEPSPSPTASPLAESPTPTPPAAQPSPSETPNVPPTPTPVVEAPATPDANTSALADVPPGILPAGSLARAAVDGVRIRRAPGTDGEVVVTLAAGETVYLASFGTGSRSEDGYFWYIAEYVPNYEGWPVRPTEFYEPGSSYRTGYVALGTPEQPFFELIEPRCTGGEPDLEAVVRITSWERLACYGDRLLVLEGTYGCGGCGGAIGPSRWEPEWLAYPLNFDWFYPSTAWFHENNQSLPLHFDPSIGLERPEGGSIIRLVGHFDDPRSRECEMALGEPGAEAVVDAALAELSCRQRFVIDSYELIGTDSDFELS